MSKKPSKPRKPGTGAAKKKPVPSGSGDRLLRLAAQLDAERNRLIEAQSVAKVGSWEADLSTLAVGWSLETYRIFGVDPASFNPTYQSFLDLVHPDDRAAMDEAFQKSLKQRRFQVAEHRVTGGDGRIKFVEERWRVIFDEKRRPLRAVGTCQDITERKLAQEERDRLFNLSLDLLCVAGFDGWLQQVSPAWTRCLGWTAQELTGRPMLDFVHPDDRALTLNVREKIHLGLPARGFENRYRGKDGAYRWLAWNVHPLPETKQVFAVGRDITELKQAEEASRRSQALLAMATRVSRLGAWQVELPGRQLTWSEELGAIHETPPGFTPTFAEVIRFYAPEYRELIQRLFNTCAEQGVPFDEEMQIVTARNRRVWVRAIGEAVRDEAGKITRMQGALQDVSEHKEAQEETRRMAARLTATLESITDAFLTIDREWRFSFLNREAERLLMRSRQELVGRSIWEEFPAAAGSLFEHEYRRALAENCTVGFEAYYPPPLDAWFAVRAFPSEQGLAVYFRDVTATRRAGEELRLSEQRFREFADNIGDVFYNYDPVHNRLLYVNSAYEKIWGYSVAESYANPLRYLESVHPEDRAVADDALRRQLAGEETVADFRVRRPEGSELWVREHAVPIRDAHGGVERIVGTMRDITRQKLAESGLRESEERFRKLLQSVPTVAIQGYATDGTVQYWNDASERFYGYTREEVLGRNLLDLIIPPAMRPEVRAALQGVEDGRNIPNGELDLIRKDGSVITVFSSHAVVRREGHPSELFCIDIDLSERKLAEQRIIEQAALLDKANDAILVLDLEHRVLYWNRSAEKLYGWTATEAVGRSVQDLIYGVSNTFVDAVKMVLASGEWAGEIDQFTKGGRTLTIEGRWTLVRDAQGRPKSVLVINTDVTERKKLERQFLRAQRMDSIGTLAGGIAHDLNNLLAPIVMGSGLLQRYELPEAGRDVLRNIEQSARRGADLVKQVLSFARGVVGERIPLQVGHLIREIEGIAGNTFPKSVIFSAKVPPDLWLVSGDATQLNQVLLNLCVNARDAMPDGGRLSLTATNREIDAQYAATDHTVSPGRYVVVEVHDTGSGMSREVMDRIFEPFFTTKELGKGTGLGLSTVLSIVRSHGGTATVRSEAGRGSTFTIWLPAHADQAAPATTAAMPALAQGQDEQILVVDDEDLVLSITRQTLEAFGYRVLTAADGAQAVGLYAIHQQEIALVITDLMMPVMDGPMLIASLQRINPRVRLIAASGLHTSEYMARAVSLGVRHFLAKPYTTETLLATLRKALTDSAVSGSSKPPM
jgi:PAS domain S-box-containing protein